jgi:hypothetical protein
MTLVKSQRRIACPRGSGLRLLSKGLQQRIAIGEMGFNDKFALQTILDGPCRLRVLAVL